MATLPIKKGFVQIFHVVITVTMSINRIYKTGILYGNVKKSIWQTIQLDQ